MKTKKIAAAEEWLKEYPAENVDVDMLLCSSKDTNDTITDTNDTTTDSNQSGGEYDNDGELKSASLKSTGIYENNFSYNPFE